MSQTEVQLIKSNSVVDGDIVGMSSSKLSGTLPAVSGANLTNLPAANLTGALPAISGAALTNLPAGGKFASYALIGDQKATNAAGGSTSTGTFNVRDINTEFADADGIVSISSNQFTLAAGSYLIEWSCPAMRCGRHQSRLYDITGSASVQVGKSTTSDTGADGDQNDSNGAVRITISANNIYEIQHQCSTTEPTSGLGNASDFGTEIFTLVKIFKEF